MRIAMFGGSFDPVHMGHLILAEQCREQAQLDQVLFIPTSTSPNKQEGARATDRQRMEMLKLAIGGHTAFEVSDMELNRGGVSYTVDTLNDLKTRWPDAELFFLLGADSVHDFHTWRQPEKILNLAKALVVERPGSPPIDLAELDKLAGFEGAAIRIECPRIEISSTAIRQKRQAQQSVRYLTPRAVQKYLETQKVYAD